MLESLAYEIIFQLVVWLGWIVLLSIVAAILLFATLYVIGTILEWIDNAVKG